VHFFPLTTDIDIVGYALEEGFLWEEPLRCLAGGGRRECALPLSVLMSRFMDSKRLDETWVGEGNRAAACHVG